MNYRNTGGEKVYGGGVEHVLKSGERLITLHGTGALLTTAGLTLHDFTGVDYSVPTSYVYFPVAICFLMGDGTNVRTVTLEYSDDADASTNAITLWSASIPPTSVYQSVVWVPVHAIAAPTGKYINVKCNVSANSPRVISVVGYQRKTADLAHSDPYINTPL